MDNRLTSKISPAPSQVVDDHQVRTVLTGLLGLDPMADDVAYTVHQIAESDEQMRIIHLSYENMLGERVPGTLIIPASSFPRPLPGVICLPGTGSHADDLIDRRYERSTDGHERLIGWARELSRRGFATLSITLRGCSIRNGGSTQWEKDARLLAPYGRTLMGVQVDEALRATGILAGHPDVDDSRIGITGMSLGGNVAWYATACAPAIKAAAIICGGLGSLEVSIKYGDPFRHSSYFYIPHLLRYFDHPRIVRTCIAPRPFMMVAPVRDEDMPAEGVTRLMKIVSPAYEKAGVYEHFHVQRPDENHIFLPQYLEWTAAWFKRHL